MSNNFGKTLIYNGYHVDIKNDVFYISKNDLLDVNSSNGSIVDTSLPVQQYSYKLKYITFDDLSSVFGVYQNVNFKYLKSYNQIVFSCTDEDYKNIRNMILSLDVPITSKNVKITIFTSSDDIASDIGLQISKLGLHLNSNFSNDISLPDFNKYIFEFDAYFSALKNNNKISISQSPTFLLTNGTKLSFQSVKNVPYLTQTNTSQNTSTSTTSSYQYKDIGLQISLIPHISKKSTLLDLDMTVEDLIDLNSDKPLTNKLTYQNTIVLNDVPVLLTGLKKTVTSKNIISIPLLSDLPFVGKAFKYQSIKNEVSNMSILIEFIPNTKDN